MTGDARCEGFPLSGVRGSGGRRELAVAVSVCRRRKWAVSVGRRKTEDR